MRNAACKFIIFTDSPMAKPFSEILQNAWNRRGPLRGRTEAYRLLNGAASETPGLAVDVFSGYLVVYAYEGERELSIRYGELSETLERVTGAKGAALKDRSAPDESGRETGRDLFGVVPEAVVVAEGPAQRAGTADVAATTEDPGAPGAGVAPDIAGAPEAAGDGSLRFNIHLRHPRNVGLFLDTRPLRDILRSSSADASVLNLFSYSCSLGAAAAAGGAASVVNVDISARYLGWGRENFGLCAVPMDRARFTRMDSEEYLDWAARKSNLYDIVILDPPSFARADGKTFSFEKDYFRLLSKAAARLKPEGRIYAVTNYGGITAARFREGVEAAIDAAGRKRGALRPIGLPEDFDPGPGGLPRLAAGPVRQGARDGAFLALEASVR